MTEQHNIAATVFVYRSKSTGEIAAHYADAAHTKDLEQWAHIATLEPRMWIQANYAAVEERGTP